MESLAVSLHALAAALWVGALAFIRFILPAGLAALEPEQRVRVLGGVLPRFLGLALICAAVAVVSGFWLFMIRFDGGPAAHIHIMAAIGVVMAAIAVYAAVGPGRTLKAMADAPDMTRAVPAIARMRLLAMLNFKLGVIAIILGVAGRALF